MTGSEIPEDENKLIAERRGKLAALRTQGPAYPNDFRRDALAGDLLAAYEARDAAWLEANPIEVRVGGRMMSKRVMGKASFAKLADRSGAIQLFLQEEALGATYAAFKGWDVGDFAGAVGTLFRTRTGELSVRVTQLKLLVKSLRPLPDKWHGLADTETRYRQRYVDLVMNEQSRAVFRARSAVIRYLRTALDALDFLEVETPMMQPIPGGAAARPFVTHHNALGIDMYLRIAPELYLKRLVVGGLERVYEINRNFRNEGLSTQHNPEFTMLEFYWAYSNYEHLMDVTEELISGLAERVLGKQKLSFKGKELDLTPPWPRLSMAGALQRFASLSPEQTSDFKGLLEVYKERGIEPPKAAMSAGLPNYGLLLSALFEELCEEHLEQPVFIIDHPVEISPLSKQKPSDPRFTERFELYIGGMEIANAFSELNDPDVQAERFRAQLAARAAGDAEAHRFDGDYVRALEHGMPPAAGFGMGIDRLTMMLTAAPSIRDVILFPLLRPE